jgi:hypothetical protein
LEMFDLVDARAGHRPDLFWIGHASTVEFSHHIY